MPKPLFSVIIPVFNRWELTRECLNTLAATTIGYDYEVIVVDNGSEDATASELASYGRKLFGEAFVALRYEVNRNFAQGSNAGAARARADLLFFLNNDTLLLPDWAPPLLRALEVETTGAVGPVLIYPGVGRAQHLGIVINHLGKAGHLYAQFPNTHRVVQRPRRMQAITGAAIMMPAALFARCGGFHEEYLNGFEDMELAWRIRQAGKCLRIIPESRIIHCESQSPGRHRHESQNNKLFLSRCQLGFLADWHKWYREDGYHVSLNQAMQLEADLAPQERKERLPLLDNLPEAYREVLQEPFWRDGYVPVIEWLSRQGHHEEAMEIAVLLTKFYPGPEAFTHMMKTSARNGMPDIARKASAEYRKYFDTLPSTARLVNTANKIRRAAAIVGDHDLIAILDDWAARHLTNPRAAG